MVPFQSILNLLSLLVLVLLLGQVGSTVAVPVSNPRLTTGLSNTAAVTRRAPGKINGWEWQWPDLPEGTQVLDDGDTYILPDGLRISTGGGGGGINGTPGRNVVDNGKNNSISTGGGGINGAPGKRFVGSDHYSVGSAQGGYGVSEGCILTSGACSPSTSKTPGEYERGPCGTRIRRNIS